VVPSAAIRSPLHPAGAPVPDASGIRGFPEAREVFNEAMRWLRRALERFQLDGWVTAHWECQMDVSALYRWLQEFEPDPARRCAMHKNRITRLEPILQVLNPN
jgi:hypothetical protein